MPTSNPQRGVLLVVPGTDRFRRYPSRANKFAATTTQSPPAWTRRPGGVRRPRHLRVRNGVYPPAPVRAIENRGYNGTKSTCADSAARQCAASPAPARPQRVSAGILPGRINSQQQLHKVHLRGLGGPAVCGVPGTCASATG
jgi:hypothetical protein